MTSLIFLLTLLFLLVMAVRAIIKVAKRKPVRHTLWVMAIVVFGYGLTWYLFAEIRKEVRVPMGTEVCFDDWCATVVKADRQVDADSTMVLLHLRMANHARGIAQTPSEPRVYILDANGRAWSFSNQGQREYEKHNGKQPGIGHRLELNQFMETVMVFKIPRASRGLRAIIEEGPGITNLLFPEDEDVFNL
jgi:hypothetical protein